MLKIIAITIIGLYVISTLLLYLFQTRLIFYPGRLPADFRFRTDSPSQEVFITTSDREKINALFFPGSRPDVLLYLHGNAGDLSGWQFVAEDFTPFGYNILIIDYRGYGKSSGSISEAGLYGDAEAAYKFLLEEKNFTPESIIVYGRSIGSGVAIDLASKKNCKGLVLESPFSSFSSLANEKVPLFFPSIYLKFRFNSIQKINDVRCPVIFLHGNRDTLIPISHTEKLHDRFQGKKMKVEVAQASHNDINAYQEYHHFLSEVMPVFFEK